MKHLLVGVAVLTVLLSLCGCRKVGLGEVKKSMEVSSANASEAEQDPLKTPAEATVAGEYMRALLSAYQDFKKDPDIPAHKKNIANYTVEFRQDDQSYIIYLIPKQTTGEGPVVGGETTLGKEVSYTISKKDYKITAHYFYK